jgi:hypothetical protein
MSITPLVMKSSGAKNVLLFSFIMILSLYLLIEELLLMLCTKSDRDSPAAGAVFC